MAIKTPLIPFNTWLTYAHSEAPVGGSIVLAGVILKLATYGYMRILLQFLPDASCYFAPMVQTIAVISIIYASLVTLRQTDFKKLVAYSSVAHAATIVLGLFSNTIQGIEGAILLGVAHGLVSPALFFLVGGVLYDRYHTRTIRYYRGITVYMPVFSIFFFLFTIFNAAVPLSANWAGEFLCLTGIFQQNIMVGLLASSGIVLSAGYSIWLYNRIAFGTWSKYVRYTVDLNRREFMILLPLLIAAVLIGIFPNIVLDTIHVSVSTLLYSPNVSPCILNNTGGPMYSCFIMCSCRSMSKITEVKMKIGKILVDKDKDKICQNPIALVNKIRCSGAPITLSLLNEILSFTYITPLTSQEYSLLTGYEEVQYNLPISQKDKTTILGTTRGKNVKKGIYIFTNILTGEKRVGSSMRIHSRYYEHINTNSSKGSKSLQKEFVKYGYANFTITLIIVDQNMDLMRLLALEQYYIIKLNPTLNHLCVVNPLPGVPSYDFLKYDSKRLLAWRKKYGKPLHIYTKQDVLLFSFVSRSAFIAVLPNNWLLFIIKGHIDKRKLYKSSIYLTSHLINSSDKPTITLTIFTEYMKNLFSTPYSHYDMQSDTKRIVKVYVASTEKFSGSEKVKTYHFSSARKCAIMLEDEYKVGISVKTITTYVAKSKKDGSFIAFIRGNYKFTLIATP